MVSHTQVHFKLSLRCKHLWGDFCYPVNTPSGQLKCTRRNPAFLTRMGKFIRIYIIFMILNDVKLSTLLSWYVKLV